MASYDEDNLPVDTPEGPNDAPDTAKVGQQEANYRRGAPVQHCGVCMMFTKPEQDGNTGGCTKVDGEISPYGLCNYYAEAKNPFGPTLGPRERSIVDEMSQSGPDQSRYGQEPQASPSLGQPPQSAGPIQQGIGGGMRIGRQAY